MASSRTFREYWVLFHDMIELFDGGGGVGGGGIRVVKAGLFLFS
jgi:hypothetical protein